jgi:uncharacterized protein YeaO (DUF488 family)
MSNAAALAAVQRIERMGRSFTNRPGKMVGARRGKGLTAIKVRRVYESREPSDGTRVLVDRLWPRGLTKEAAAVDHWMRDLAPSTALRKWFGHDPARWDEFRRRYAAELREREALLEELRELARHGPVTLVFGARDERHNDAVALLEILASRR